MQKPQYFKKFKKNSKDKKEFKDQLRELKDKIGGIISERWVEATKNNDMEIVIWTGVTNSGKSYNSIKDLKQPGIIGCYNAPLRLLASEVYKKLNDEGIKCNLTTGEERHIVNGATITANTIEMLDYSKEYDVAIIDECQLIGVHKDQKEKNTNDRGWAWLKAILKIRTKKLHLIVAPNGLNLITSILDRLNRVYLINKCERKVPLEVCEKPDNFNKIKELDKTAIIVFSRNDVLSYKNMLEDMGIPVSVVYGNLPPEVKNLQIEKFNSGESKIIVATDCIGLGINICADRLIFGSISKFDGVQQRDLDPDLIKQVGNRCGRYLLSICGYVSAFNKQNLKFIKAGMDKPFEELKFAMIAPDLDELEKILSDRLVDKLLQWKKMSPIPDELKDLVLMSNIEERIELANKISLEYQKILGLENTYLLVNAPISDGIVEYWLSCIKSIVSGNKIPIPQKSSNMICSKQELLVLENEIKKHELYCWISLRKNFESYSDLNSLDEVIDSKYEMIMLLDAALCKFNKLKNVCTSCGEELDRNSKFKICDDCYQLNY